jgi:hypothetical protein
MFIIVIVTLVQLVIVLPDFVENAQKLSAEQKNIFRSKVDASLFSIC